jgi:hypothetical protein
MLDLHHSTRDDLIRIIRRQGELIATLEDRLARQERESARPWPPSPPNWGRRRRAATTRAARARQRGCRA